jgi:glycosyltransferase involved in cell wall biosynthesis
MRMAFISTMDEFPWGGSEELWSRTASLALLRGHQVLVSVADWGDLHPRLKDLKHQGAVVHVRGSRRREFKPYELQTTRSRKDAAFLRSGVSLVYLLMKFKPQAVCISQGGTYDLAKGVMLRKILSRLGVPYFIIVHFNDEREILSDQERENAKQVFAGATQVFFVAERNRRATERQLASRIPNSKVILNPVNLSSIPPFKAVAGDKAYFAIVGRLQCRAKGQDILLEVLSNDRWRTRHWELNLYGAGPDEEYLKQLSVFYDISDKVHFRGQSDNIRTVWARNHLQLMPSRAEGTPLALVEAMLCWRPAVVTDVGGNADYVQENSTGFLADAATVGSFALAMERAWESRDKWEALGRNAHSFVRKMRVDRAEEFLLDYLSDVR